jgi:hypothetical protein
MARSSFLRDQYLVQANSSIPNSEPISPVHASLDPRFSSLFVRATNYRELASQQKVSPANLLHSPSTITVNSNAWSPAQASDEKLPNAQK